MAYFLRFTDTAKEDLERGTSIHASDDGNDDILDGICGYDIEAHADSSDLDEILEYIEEEGTDSFQFSFVGKAVLFEGRYSQDSNNVPDGDCFYPDAIIKEF